MIYKTNYKCSGVNFRCFLVAEPKKAKRLIEERGLEERIVGIYKTKPYTVNTAFLFEQERYVKCLHMLTFAGNVLCNAGLYGRYEMLSDQGLIHAVVHEMELKGTKWDLPERDKRRNLVIAALKRFDEKAKEIGF